MEKLEVFRELQYNKQVYSVVYSDANIKKIEYSIYKDGCGLKQAVSYAVGESVIFNVQESGELLVCATIYDQNGEIRQLDKSIVVPQVAVESQVKSRSASRVVFKKSKQLRVMDVEDYLLEIKFSANGYALLAEDAQRALPLFKAFNERHLKDAVIAGEVLVPAFSAAVRAKYTSGLLDNLYKTPFSAGFLEMQAVADELQQLSYVEYCSVTALRASDESEIATVGQDSAQRSSTPNFIDRQTYLNAFPGINARAAWLKNITGTGASVHVVDSGIYQNHENLIGNFTLVTNRGEDAVRNHGTACAGIIAARATTFGMTGIAHRCRLYSYEASINSLDLLIQRAQPGDIVSISIGLVTSVGRLPLISNQTWWTRFRALTDLGVNVFCSASNGGLDIARNMTDLGDSGVILVGSSDPVTSRRISSSNYNHYALVANAWGRGVAAPGYGRLYGTNVNNYYTATFSGTSSACPIVAGCVALVQGYAKERYGVFLKNEQIRDMIIKTGNNIGIAEQIGYKPDVLKGLEYVDNLLGHSGQPAPEPAPEPTPTPVPEPTPLYPLWQRNRTYTGGSRVSHLGGNYLAKWWISANVEPGLESTTGRPDGDGRPWTRI